MKNSDPHEPALPIDVFFSYRSSDREAVLALKSALLARGLRAWIDVDELPPGMNWQPRIDQALRAARSIAVLVGGDGLGPWQDEELQGTLQWAVSVRRPVIPVLLPTAGDQIPALPLFLTNRTWVDLRPQLNETGLDRLQWGITGQMPRGSSPRPVDSAGQRTADDNPFDPRNGSWRRQSSPSCCCAGGFRRRVCHPFGTAPQFQKSP